MKRLKRETTVTIGPISMMNLFDTHAHFSRLEGEYSLEAQFKRARESGVTRIVAVGGDCELNKAAVDAARFAPDMVQISLGMDRDNVEKLSNLTAINDAVDRIRSSIIQLTKSGIKTCAIGEIGLDYHYSAETAKEQVALFNAQLDLATELELPVIIHSREADDDTLEALTKHAESWKGTPDRIGVLHCFTRSTEFAEKLLKLGYHISFSGIVTFLNADPLREVAKSIPDDRILIETDSPYLAPAPMRGNRNEPAFVKHVATRLAELRGVTDTELANQTFDNGSYLFNFGD